MLLALLAFPGMARAVEGDRALLAYQEALDRLMAGEQAAARAIAQGMSDPLAPQLIDWLILRDPDAPVDFFSLRAFLTGGDGTEWPGRASMIRRAEAQLVRNPPQGLSDGEMLRWFASFPPGRPQAAEMAAKALIRQGDPQQAADLLGKAWIDGDFEAQDERRFLDSYGASLTPEHHRQRFSRLVAKDELTSAARMVEILPDSERAAARATLAFARNDRDAMAKLEAVPEAQRDRDPELLRQRVIWHRKRDEDSVASRLLLLQPQAPSNIDLWFKERERQIRRALDRGDPTLAYRLAASHGATEGVPFAEGEELASWIALRFLNRPGDAREHAERMHGGVRSAFSRSAAAYWAGRAAKAEGDQEGMTRWHEEAGRYPTVFFGQMALAELRRPIRLTGAAAPGPQDRARFEARPLVRAVRILHAVGHDGGAIASLLEGLREQLTDPAERVLGTRLALEVEHPFNATRIANKALSDGIDLGLEGFPYYRLPRLLAGNAPDSATIHAIIRQESAFDIDIKSSAGATGLMQLMPGTASDTARKLSVQHEPGRLDSDPAYNIQLGAKYLGDQLDRYSDALVLAAAAYNAGPGNLRKWLDSLGDPTTGSVDAIDWIERIPFTETRTYVQRVTANYNVYRVIASAAAKRRAQP